MTREHRPERKRRIIGPVALLLLIVAGLVAYHAVTKPRSQPCFLMPRGAEPAPLAVVGKASGHSESLTLALAGDAMLGRGINSRLGREMKLKLWRQLTPALRDVDIFGFNLESAITTETSPWGPWKKFRFKALPANARRALSFPTGAALFASVANNHILDFGPSGLDGTLTTLDEAGITHTGAGSNSANAWRPAVITTKAGVRER